MTSAIAQKNELVMRLYEAAANLADDTDVLDDMRDWIGSEHVMISEDGPSGRIVRTCSNLAGFDAIAAGGEEAALDWERYLQIQIRPGTVVRQSDHVDVAVFRSSSLYRDVLRPLDGGLSAFSTWGSESGIFSISLCRKITTDFTETELQQIEGVIPHVRAAQKVRNQLKRANTLTLAAGAAFEAMEQGLILFDAQSRLAYQNAAATAILDADKSLKVTSRGLEGRNSVATGQLNRAFLMARKLGKALPDLTTSGDMKTSLSLPRHNLRPLNLSFFPVSGLAVLNGSAVSADWVALLIADSEKTSVSSAVKLAEAFSLTPREAELVACVANGDTLSGAAVRLSISHETARQYLKRAFVKMDVHRQAELVRLAMRVS